MEQLRGAKGSELCIEAATSASPPAGAVLGDPTLKKNQFTLSMAYKATTHPLNPKPIPITYASLTNFGSLVEEVYYVIWNGQITSKSLTEDGIQYNKGALSTARWNQSILSKNWSYKQWNMNVQGNRYGSSWDYRNSAAFEDGKDNGIQYDYGASWEPGDFTLAIPVPIPMKCGDGPVWWTPPSWISLLKSKGAAKLDNYLKDNDGKSILQYYQKLIGVWEWNDQLVALGQQLMMSNFTRPFEKYYFDENLYQYNTGQKRQVWRNTAPFQGHPPPPLPLQSGYHLSPILQPSLDLLDPSKTVDTLQDVIRYLVKPDDMINDEDASPVIVGGLVRHNESSKGQRPLIPPLQKSKGSDAHSKGVLMWDQNGKTIYLSTSATLYPLSGGDNPTPFGNSYGSVGKNFGDNDQQVLCVKYDYKNAFRLFEQLSKIRPLTQIYNPSLSNIPSAWVTPPSQGGLKPYFNLMKLFSKTSHLKKEPWWGPKDPWNPEVGLIKRVLMAPLPPTTGGPAPLGITADAAFGNRPMLTPATEQYFWGPSKGARLCAKALSIFDIEMGGFRDLPSLPPSLGGWHVPTPSSSTNITFSAGAPALSCVTGGVGVCIDNPTTTQEGYYSTSGFNDVQPWMWDNTGYDFVGSNVPSPAQQCANANLPTEIAPKWSNIGWVSPPWSNKKIKVPGNWPPGRLDLVTQFNPKPIYSQVAKNYMLAKHYFYAYTGCGRIAGVNAGIKIFKEINDFINKGSGAGKDLRAAVQGNLNTLFTRRAQPLSASAKFYSYLTVLPKNSTDFKSFFGIKYYDDSKYQNLVDFSGIIGLGPSKDLVNDILTNQNKNDDIQAPQPTIVRFYNKETDATQEGNNVSNWVTNYGTDPQNFEKLKLSSTIIRKGSGYYIPDELSYNTFEVYLITVIIDSAKSSATLNPLSIPTSPDFNFLKYPKWFGYLLDIRRMRRYDVDDATNARIMGKKRKRGAAVEAPSTASQGKERIIERKENPDKWDTVNNFFRTGLTGGATSAIYTWADRPTINYNIKQLDPAYLFTRWPSTESAYVLSGKGYTGTAAQGPMINNWEKESFELFLGNYNSPSDYWNNDYKFPLPLSRRLVSYNTQTYFNSSETVTRDEYATKCFPFQNATSTSAKCPGLSFSDLNLNQIIPHPCLTFPRKNPYINFSMKNANNKWTTPGLSEIEGPMDFPNFNTTASGASTPWGKQYYYYNTTAMPASTVGKLTFSTEPAAATESLNHYWYSGGLELYLMNNPEALNQTNMTSVLTKNFQDFQHMVFSPRPPYWRLNLINTIMCIASTSAFDTEAITDPWWQVVTNYGRRIGMPTNICCTAEIAHDSTPLVGATTGEYPALCYYDSGWTRGVREQPSSTNLVVSHPVNSDIPPWQMLSAILKKSLLISTWAGNSLSIPSPQCGGDSTTSEPQGLRSSLLGYSTLPLLPQWENVYKCEESGDGCNQGPVSSTSSYIQPLNHEMDGDADDVWKKRVGQSADSTSSSLIARPINKELIKSDTEYYIPDTTYLGKVWNNMNTGDICFNKYFDYPEKKTNPTDLRLNPKDNAIWGRCTAPHSPHKKSGKLCSKVLGDDEGAGAGAGAGGGAGSGDDYLCPPHQECVANSKDFKMNARQTLAEGGCCKWRTYGGICLNSDGTVNNSQSPVSSSEEKLAKLCTKDRGVWYSGGISYDVAQVYNTTRDIDWTNKYIINDLKTRNNGKFGKNIPHISAILKDDVAGGAGKQHIKLGVTLDTPYEISNSGKYDFYNNCVSCGVIISDLNENTGIRESAAKLLQKTKPKDVSADQQKERKRKLMEEIIKKETVDIDIGLPKGVMASTPGSNSTCAASQGERGGLSTVIFNRNFWRTMKNAWTGNSINIKKSIPEVSFIGPKGKGGDDVYSMCRDIIYNRPGTIFSCDRENSNPAATPDGKYPLDFLASSQAKDRFEREPLYQMYGCGPSNIVFPTKYNRKFDPNLEGGGVGLYYGRPSAAASPLFFSDGPADVNNILYNLYKELKLEKDSDIYKADIIYQVLGNAANKWGYSKFLNKAFKSPPDAPFPTATGIWVATPGAPPVPTPSALNKSLTKQDIDNYKQAAKFYNFFCWVTIAATMEGEYSLRSENVVLSGENAAKYGNFIDGTLLNLSNDSIINSGLNIRTAAFPGFSGGGDGIPITIESHGTEAWKTGWEVMSNGPGSEGNIKFPLHTDLGVPASIMLGVLRFYGGGWSGFPIPTDIGKPLNSEQNINNGIVCKNPLTSGICNPECKQICCKKWQVGNIPGKFGSDSQQKLWPSAKEDIKKIKNIQKQFLPPFTPIAWGDLQNIKKERFLPPWFYGADCTNCFLQAPQCQKGYNSYNEDSNPGRQGPIQHFYNTTHLYKTQPQMKYDQHSGYNMTGTCTGDLSSSCHGLEMKGCIDLPNCSWEDACTSSVKQEIASSGRDPSLVPEVMDACNNNQGRIKYLAQKAWTEIGSYWVPGSSTSSAHISPDFANQGYRSDNIDWLYRPFSSKHSFSENQTKSLTKI